jgi:formylglycine-generating enzyme required for sulfatase activity
MMDLGYGRSWRAPSYPQEDEHPVVCATWRDATDYAQWLSERTGFSYRLLTEAEWEYAARAGSRTIYSFGDSEKDLCRYGNLADGSAKRVYGNNPSWTFVDCDDSYAYTAPVGSYLPNAFGLHDMQGNVLQWVQDCYVETYDKTPTDSSPSATGDCTSRVLRGGSWYSTSVFLRMAARGHAAPSDTSFETGFRVARTLFAP